jgi:hypothetical protein
MDSKLLATTLSKALKEMGHEIPLGHVYEALSKASGHKSWNHAKASPTGLNPVLSVVSAEPVSVGGQWHVEWDNGADEEEERESGSFFGSASNLEEACVIISKEIGFKVTPKLFEDNEEDGGMRAELITGLKNFQMYFDEGEMAEDYYEVKVNASVTNPNGDEIELKKYYHIYAPNEVEAKHIVYQYLAYRNGDVDEVPEIAKGIAAVESEDDFKHKNWEVIYLSGAKIVTTDVYKK